MEKLEPRKEALLDSLVREYVQTAEPVGSVLLAERARLNVSSATVRSELAVLEEEGYLIQPHTSAGRIPTERAYRYFVEHLASPKTPERGMASELERELAEHDDRAGWKQAARRIASYSGECVFISFGNHDVYYTGVAELFAKPEFHSHDAMLALSGMLDEIEIRVDGLAESAAPKVLIGSDNPFSEQSSALYVSLGDGVLMGMLGLMRMDYERNIGLLDLWTKKIKH